MYKYEQLGTMDFEIDEFILQGRMRILRDLFGKREKQILGKQVFRESDYDRFPEGRRYIDHLIVLAVAYNPGDMLDHLLRSSIRFECTPPCTLIELDILFGIRAELYH